MEHSHGNPLYLDVFPPDFPGEIPKVGGLGDLYVCGAWAVELPEHQTGAARRNLEGPGR